MVGDVYHVITGIVSSPRRANALFANSQRSLFPGNVSIFTSDPRRARGKSEVWELGARGGWDSDAACTKRCCWLMLFTSSLHPISFARNRNNLPECVSFKAQIMSLSDVDRSFLWLEILRIDPCLLGYRLDLIEQVSQGSTSHERKTDWILYSDLRNDVLPPPPNPLCCISRPIWASMYDCNHFSRAIFSLNHYSKVRTKVELFRDGMECQK